MNCTSSFLSYFSSLSHHLKRAKYPLAVLSKEIDTLDPKSAAGFDIACSFQSTVKSSSLCNKFVESRTLLCVNSFHSYAHSFICQLHNHSVSIPGTGLKDFETMEHIFSASNQLASVTRYASLFCRQLYIKTYFQQWDEDKYSNLGIFLLNNYKQALSIIRRDSVVLSETLATLKVDHQTLDMWEKEELTYFETLSQKPA